jgi:hypothetical protein
MGFIRVSSSVHYFFIILTFSEALRTSEGVTRLQAIDPLWAGFIATATNILRVINMQQASLAVPRCVEYGPRLCWFARQTEGTTQVGFCIN